MQLRKVSPNQFICTFFIFVALKLGASLNSALVFNSMLNSKFDANLKHLEFIVVDQNKIGIPRAISYNLRGQYKGH